MHRDPMELPARFEVLASLGLPGPTEERALILAAEGPDEAAWAALLGRLLLFAGAALALAGIVCFFAFNWQSLHRFGKFAMVAAGLLGCAAGARKVGFGRTSAKVLLLAATVLLGVWLAIYGQAYQTGADPFELFRGWALLALPWVLLARFPALWAFWLLLLNLWLGLWWNQAASLDPNLLPWTFVALNGLAWLLWEGLGGLLDWMAGRWLPRVLGLATLALLLVPALGVVAEGHAHRADPMAWTLPATLALGALMLFAFIRLRRDLFMVTLGLAAFIALLTTFLGRWLLRGVHSDGCGVVVLLGFLVVAQVGGASAWLRKLHQEVP